jgi:hypothetical protein
MKTTISLLYIFCISLIFQVKLLTTTSPSCNIYPKILGGVQADTKPTAMDANFVADKIVAGGLTLDSGLVPTIAGSGTFVAAFSILTTRIYWAKVDTSKSWLTPLSISLSPNANFAIVFIKYQHGYHFGFL